MPDKFTSHLLQPPPDYLEQKLPMLKTTQAQVNALDPLIICGLRGIATVHPTVTKPKLIDIVSHTIQVTPASLEELKELVGVPTRAFARRVQPAGAPTRLLHAVTPKMVASLPEKITVSKLQLEQRTSFFQVAENLLHGPTDEKTLDQPGYRQAVAAMLRASARIPVFVAPDLVVCDGDAVDFTGYAAMYFNNVIVQGSGRIILGHNTKLHAFQIKRV